MSAPNAQIQWYLAREGKQYGPLTEVELSKFVELGHLLPSDLLWREGFPDWQPALSVFPVDSKPSAPPSPARLEPEPAMAATRPGAQEAMAAAAQGRFWEVHDRIFASPRDLDDDTLRRYARELSARLDPIEALRHE